MPIKLFTGYSLKCHCNCNAIFQASILLVRFESSITKLLGKSTSDCYFILVSLPLTQNAFCLGGPAFVSIRHVGVKYLEHDCSSNKWLSTFSLLLISLWACINPNCTTLPTPWNGWNWSHFKARPISSKKKLVDIHSVAWDHWNQAWVWPQHKLLNSATSPPNNAIVSPSKIIYSSVHHLFYVRWM